jgi:L-ascorbate metabolism protein UlaG (beta-lactamase superfamily)
MPTSLLFAALLNTAILNNDDAKGRLCHIANAGFFIESAGNGILIDTVIDQGLEGYVQPSKPLLAKIEKGLAPFDNIKLVLITHYHADHFDPASTLRHLRANKDTHYIMPPQAFEAVRRLNISPDEIKRVHTPLPDIDGNAQSLETANIKTAIYRISHGANRPIENLGYKITVSNDISVFHPGDMSTTKAQLNSVGLDRTPIDYLLLPFWTSLNTENGAIVEAAWDAKHIIPMHFQEENRDWMKQYGGPIGVQKAARSTWDNSITLTGEMKCINF